MEGESSEGFKNKREFIRIKGGAVEYKEIDSQEEYQSAFLVDIGQGGVCLFVMQVIEPNIKLSLKIFLDSNPTPVLLDAEVVWVRNFNISEEKAAEHYYVGLQTIRISKSDKAKITHYLNHFGPDGELPHQDDTLNL